MTVTLRPLTLHDVPAALRLHKFAKLDGHNIFSLESQKNVVELLNSAAAGEAGVHGHIACAAGGEAGAESEVVGVLTAEWEDTRTCVLLTLVVRSDHRGKGVGKELLEELLRSACTQGSPVTIVTDVALANSPAVTFFKRQGFKQTHRSHGRSMELSLTCAFGTGSTASEATLRHVPREVAVKSLRSGWCSLNRSRARTGLLHSAPGARTRLLPIVRGGGMVRRGTACLQFPAPSRLLAK
ncbi:hypothetical protein Agub_g9904 [Astrephomene gubernaculifera]|uniref:N-acetyltransferase domain-containing protein n=1 Tax=Astrephomene gubernaculifera TaxID=47775 RepID=A0AAD3DWR6_9CHLO|nr:hypothetical protein Agub_g9904 [Astrephomene gubernaculifera]